MYNVIHICKTTNFDQLLLAERESERESERERERERDNGEMKNKIYIGDSCCCAGNRDGERERE